MSTTIERQLEELELIRCSVMPGEVFAFADDDDDRWPALLDKFSIERSVTDDEIPTSPLSIEIGLEGHDLRISVGLPGDYPDISKLPSVSVKGTTISRSEQHRWSGLLRERLHVAAETEQPAYTLVALNLFPLLHEDAEKQAHVSAAQDQPTVPPAPPLPPYHALLTSHHLVSPTKRRNMQAWTAALGLSGFAKVGYPGVIYAHGARDAVEDFVGRVRGMQWLALRLRFLEALPEGGEVEGAGERRWGELQRVGEVVEEMRRLGREKYVTEMGIGTSGGE
ncbi:hypothetical protein HDZ31DRAFT_28102 [Schizophyllum fasciatum]